MPHRYSTFNGGHLDFQMYRSRGRASGIISLEGADQGNVVTQFLPNEMLFLTNEPAKKTEINILTARDTTGPGY